MGGHSSRSNTQIKTPTQNPSVCEKKAPSNRQHKTQYTEEKEKPELICCRVACFCSSLRGLQRKKRGTSSNPALFNSSQVGLMAVSNICLFGSVCKRTRSGALASSAQRSLPKLIKESRGAKEAKEINCTQVEREYLALRCINPAIWTNSTITLIRFSSAALTAYSNK